MVHKFTPQPVLSTAKAGWAPLRRRVKVEFQDDSGTKYSLAVEGRLSREKVMKLMDLMDMVDDGSHDIEAPKPDGSTRFGKVQQILQKSYLAKEFSSADIAHDYEDTYGQPVELSIISTYLARMAQRGYLARQKFGSSWVYRMVHLRVDQETLK